MYYVNDLVITMYVLELVCNGIFPILCGSNTCTLRGNHGLVYMQRNYSRGIDQAMKKLVKGIRKVGLCHSIGV